MFHVLGKMCYFDTSVHISAVSKKLAVSVIFLLRDSRGKRTSKRARKSSAALKRDARVEQLV